METMRPRGLFEYLGILWRKKLLILLVAASVSIATLQIISRIPNVYESHALIVISNQGNANNDPSLQRARRLVLWGLRWLGLAAFLGAMIPALIIVFDRAQIFQILGNR